MPEFITARRLNRRPDVVADAFGAGVRDAQAGVAETVGNVMTGSMEMAGSVIQMKDRLGSIDAKERAARAELEIRAMHSEAGQIHQNGDEYTQYVQTEQLSILARAEDGADRFTSRHLTSQLDLIRRKSEIDTNHAVGMIMFDQMRAGIEKLEPMYQALAISDPSTRPLQEQKYQAALEQVYPAINRETAAKMMNSFRKGIDTGIATKDDIEGINNQINTAMDQPAGDRQQWVRDNVPLAWQTDVSREVGLRQERFERDHKAKSANVLDMLRGNIEQDVREQLAADEGGIALDPRKGGGIPTEAFLRDAGMLSDDIATYFAEVEAFNDGVHGEVGVTNAGLGLAEKMKAALRGPDGAVDVRQLRLANAKDYAHMGATNRDEIEAELADIEYGDGNLHKQRREDAQIFAAMYRDRNANEWSSAFENRFLHKTSSLLDRRRAVRAEQGQVLQQSDYDEIYKIAANDTEYPLVGAGYFGGTKEVMLWEMTGTQMARLIQMAPKLKDLPETMQGDVPRALAWDGQDVSTASEAQKRASLLRYYQHLGVAQGKVPL